MSLFFSSAVIATAQNDSASLTTPKNQVGFIGVYGGLGTLLMDESSGQQNRFGIASEVVIGRKPYGHWYVCGQLEYLNSNGTATLMPGYYVHPFTYDTTHWTSKETVDYTEAGALLGVGVCVEWISVDLSFLADYMTQGMTESTVTINDPDQEHFDTTLYEPGEAEFRDDGRTMVVGRYALSDFNTWRMGVQIAPKARITFSPIQVVIAPSYRMYFNELMDTNFDSTQMFAVDISVGIML